MQLARPSQGQGSAEQITLTKHATHLPQRRQLVAVLDPLGDHLKLQIDCQAETYLGAKALAEAVLDAMNAATTFDSDPEPDQQEGYEPESGIFTVSLDFNTGNYEE